MVRYHGKEIQGFFFTCCYAYNPFKVKLYQVGMTALQIDLEIRLIIPACQSLSPPVLASHASEMGAHTFIREFLMSCLVTDSYALRIGMLYCGCKSSFIHTRNNYSLPSIVI